MLGTSCTGTLTTTVPTVTTTGSVVSPTATTVPSISVTDTEQGCQFNGRVSSVVVTDFSISQVYVPDPDDLSGVTIELLDDSQKVKYSTDTDSSGRYEIPAIVPGIYHVKVSRESFLTCEHELVLEPGEKAKRDYSLIPRLPDHTPGGAAAPRFKEMTVPLANLSPSSSFLVNQLETNIIITTNGLGAPTPNYYLYNAVRYHAEGILLPASERVGMTDDEIRAITGAVDWSQHLAIPNPPITPSCTLGYIPTANPAVDAFGQPLYDFETLAAIELDYLKKVLGIYRDAGMDYPYYTVGGEFNISAMNMEYPVDDIVAFYDACARLVKDYFPTTQVGIAMNNCYDYGDYHFPPFADKSVFNRMINSGTYVTNVEFIRRLADRGCPFDFVATEIHLGETDPYSFEFLEWYCNELIKAGGKLYLWEFWVISEDVSDYPEGHFDGIGRYLLPPEGAAGINRENQAAITGRFLDYVAATPAMLGFQCDGQSPDGVLIPGRMVPVPSDYGYFTSDGAAKPVFYTHSEWIKNNLFCLTAPYMKSDSMKITALPGLYEVYYYDSSGITHCDRYILDEGRVELQRGQKF